MEEAPTAKPTVYVYQATGSQIVKDHERRGRGKKSPFDDDRFNRVFQPSSHSIRVALQAGWHIAHHLHKKKAGGQMVRPLGEMAWHAKRLTKIDIEPASSTEIRRQLAGMGIRHGTMFPDLQSVCRSINAMLNPT